VIADAVAEGLIARTTKNSEAAEPLAEWERELLEQSTVVAEAVEAPVAEAVEAPVAEAEAPVAEAEAPAPVEAEKEAE
jgi:small subunit ribosomal protein S2